MMNRKRIASITAAVFIFITLLLPNLMHKTQAAEITSGVGIVSISSGSLNVRSTASNSSTILTRLSKNAHVTLLWKTGNWWRVEYAFAEYGYVSANYIDYVYGTYAAMISANNGNLNVRKGPGLGYGIQTTIPHGRTVLVLSQSGGWSKIVYNGSSTGYVSTKYLASLMAWPVPASHKINQTFGTHAGLDIGSVQHGVAGDSIVAAQGGKVVYSGWLNGYGYVVYINSVYNGKPLQTRYAHLQSAPLVKAGDDVGAGQKIGAMGNTGTSTGVHLHFEVRIRSSTAECIANIDSSAVNPQNYVAS